MINPVSPAPVTQQPVVPQNAKPPQQASSSATQDSVHLSTRAQTHASGDVEHDGDSH
jgi:hypothetical protein